MNELIENTINIISKITLSNYGYLLLLSEQGNKVLKIWGWKGKDYEVLNDVLFNLYLSGNLNTENITGHPAVETILKKNSLSGLFINELVNISERNQVIYLLLFFKNEKDFTGELKDRAISAISILSSQVREWYENVNVRSSTVQKTEINEDSSRIFEDWQISFNLLLENSPDLIFVTGQSGKIILVNKAGSEILDYKPAELKGKHLTELIDQDDYAAVSKSLNLALIKNIQIKFKANLCSKYEELFPFEVSCQSVISNGMVLGMIGICRDLSEKSRYESELKKLKPKLIETDRLLSIERTRSNPQSFLIEEMNRLKFEFISNISHEFRTTLASIIGFSETIESDPDLPEEMKKEFNRVIMSEGKRLAKLINDILDASPVDEIKIVLNKKRMDLIKLIQEAIKANSDLADVKKITVTFDHPAEKILIEADEESLFQLINALLNNAIKFTSEYGRVKLIVNNLFREVELIVSDTGIGIPEGDLPFIFQKFYKVSRLKTDYPALGVGLVFVKQVIDLHKGLITVQSEPGSGTTFLVKLPKTSKIEKPEVTIE
jgi:PAS domain S-box-containing protein